MSPPVKIVITGRRRDGVYAVTIAGQPNLAARRAVRAGFSGAVGRRDLKRPCRFDPTTARRLSRPAEFAQDHRAQAGEGAVTTVDGPLTPWRSPESRPIGSGVQHFGRLGARKTETAARATILCLPKHLQASTKMKLTFF